MFFALLISIPLWLLAIIVGLFGAVVMAMLIEQSRLGNGRFGRDLLPTFIQVVSAFAWLVLTLVVELILK